MSSATKLLTKVEAARQQLLSAAKDKGSSKKDKSRQAALQDLVAMADDIREELDLTGFPEVQAACKQVDKLKDMVQKMMELQIKLRAAPNNTEEAAQLQRDLDALRASVDTMVKPLEATMETMEALAHAAVALEEQFALMSEEVTQMEGKLKADKARLASMAEAVEKAAQTS